MEPLKKLNVDLNNDDINKKTSNSSTEQIASAITNTIDITSKTSNQRIIQNYRLIWIDININEYSNEDSMHIIAKLREIVNDVQKFTDVNECVDHITDIEDEQIFLICSAELGKITLPLIHHISQIHSIYIFCQNMTQHEQWTKNWSKVQGIYKDIISICGVLKQVAHDCDHNSISISFVQTNSDTSNQALDTLDPSFMYTQILKEILLTIDFEQSHINEFLNYCRKLFINNTKELRNIDKIQMEYNDYLPVWWYTYNCFLYSMLNRALRTMEVDLIIKMGFFIRDLHNSIVELHADQFGQQIHTDSCTVYRGQGLPFTDFEKLQRAQGGLLSFNNFLSTSESRAVSLKFARQVITTSDLLGILFVILIDPSISITPFAKATNVSCYQKEEEILFSMHSVFRVGQITQLDGVDRLWQVDLTLTSDNDPQLQAVTESIQDETRGLTGWYKLVHLMIKLGQFNKAEELCDILFKQTSGENEKFFLHNILGLVKNNQGDYAKAIEFYEKTFGNNASIFSSTNPLGATSYNNIGLVYVNMGEYLKALSYYEKAFEIDQKTLPANHPRMATSYNNMGRVCINMGEYLKALSYYEKAFEIDQKTLPENHPNMATSYNNIGEVYVNMGEYSKALSYYEKALKIFQKTLPANHPDVAQSYNNIATVYVNMGEYSKALSYYEKALEIFQKALPENHPNIATSYNNIGEVYRRMGEFSKALSFHEKAFEIYQKTLPENHPNIATSYNNIAMVYVNMSEYSKALSYYEKAFEIDQKTLPANHPSMATSYNNIGGVYVNMGEYSKALSYYEKALEIFQKALPENHPNIATSYNNIAMVYYSMGEYSKAISYFEQALNILRRSLSPDHPNVKLVKQSIEIVKKRL